MRIFEVLKNDFKRWIETTKTEQKPKLAGHFLLDREAVWDMEERNWSNMFIDFSLSFFHIYLQSLSVKTAEIHGYSCYQKKDKVESSSLPFFKISLKVKRRKKWHRETKGQRQLSPFWRRQGLRFIKGNCGSKSSQVACLSAYRFKHT